MSPLTGDAQQLSLRNVVHAALRSRSGWALAGMAALVPAVVGATGHGRVAGVLASGAAALSRCDATLIWLAATAFALSLVASAGAWKTAFGACGARVGLRDACTRYGVGSLVNSVAPMRLGEAARIVLFSRTLLQERGQALRAAGVLAPVALARAIVQAVLVSVGTVSGALPLWPLAGLAALASCAALAAVLLRDRLPARVASLLDASRALVRSPKRAASLLGWTAAAAIARVLAASTVVAAIGFPWSLGTGLVVTAAVGLATSVPLTPGNIGITSGAVAFALEAKGIPLAGAVASGLAFHAVETAVGVTFGVTGAALLAPYHSPQVRRWGLRLGGAASAVLLGTAFGASVFPGLV